LFGEEDLFQPIVLDDRSAGLVVFDPLKQEDQAMYRSGGEIFVKKVL
jgi:hypothetical protein